MWRFGLTLTDLTSCTKYVPLCLLFKVETSFILGDTIYYYVLICVVLWLCEMRRINIDSLSPRMYTFICILSDA